MSLQTEIQARKEILKTRLANINESLVNKGMEPVQNFAAVPAAIDAIEAGGSSEVKRVEPKDVNFYDCDGTLLYSYTLEEAANLTALPPLPTRDGLICQEWNWTLEDIMSAENGADVGPTYTTADGNTRIYIEVDEYTLTLSVGLYLKGTITLDWGDGSTTEWTSNYASYNVSPEHTYAEPGEYVITIIGTGTTCGLTSNGLNYGMLITNSENAADGKAVLYLSTIRAVEIGENIKNIYSKYVFYGCTNLQRVTAYKGFNFSDVSFKQCCLLKFLATCHTSGIPIMAECSSLETISLGGQSEGNIGIRAFSECHSLRRIIIPSNVTTVSSYYNQFEYCHNLKKVVLPDAITVVNKHMFSHSNSLREVVIPSSVTEIQASAFYNCYSLKVVDFSRHETIPALSATNAFSSNATGRKILVPSALLSQWKAATNWSTYADQIVGV